MSSGNCIMQYLLEEMQLEHLGPIMPGKKWLIIIILVGLAKEMQRK